MLYYELEDGLYTAGPYFFAKVRADSKCFQALQKRVLWKHPAKYSLWQPIPNSLEELQRLVTWSTERPGLRSRNETFLGIQNQERKKWATPSNTLHLQSPEQARRVFPGRGSERSHDSHKATQLPGLGRKGGELSQVLAEFICQLPPWSTTLECSCSRNPGRGQVHGS